MSKTLNLDELLNMLGIANSSSEKAAIIAETVFADMPELTAIIARRCIVLHWFDQSILSALLSDLSVSNEYARNLYQQLSELPFVERINFGLTYHSLTREGLLKNYVNAQSDLLIKSCTLAAPQYGKQYDNSSFLREALFCYILAGNTSIALELLDRLLIHSASRSDWQSLSIALQIQDEAEKFHFVSPIPRYAHHWLARAISYYEQGDFKASLECYEYAWKVNKDFGTIPQNREVVDKNFQTWKNFFNKTISSGTEISRSKLAVLNNQVKVALANFSRSRVTDIAEQNFLARLQRGDEAAWEQFVVEWTPRLYSYLTYNLRNSEETDDILSETMLAIVQAIRTFDGKTHLATFVYSMAYRKVADHWRRLRVTQGLDESIAAPNTSFNNTEVYEALSKLPEQSQQALLLRYHVGLSVAEIAEVLGRSYQATETLLSRVRRAFEPILQNRLLSDKTL